jgi:hypothetical protein
MTVEMHWEDIAFLDDLVFDSTDLRRCCDRCDRQVDTTVIGCIEQGSGPGYEIRHCRACIAVYLSQGRSRAEKHHREYTPSIPGVPTI